MTYSEHLRIMEMEYAEADNSMIDIDFMLESAEASHRLDVADLDFKFESCDDYDQDAKVQMYMTEAKTFGDKVKAAWNKFVEWLRGIVAKIFKLKPDDAKAKKAEKDHPKGIKLPFNIGEAEKNMDKMNGFLNSGSIKRLTADVDKLAKDGIKVSVDIKHSGKLTTYQGAPVLNQFLSAASGIVKAVAMPAGAVVGVGVLMKFMNKSLNFTQNIQNWAKDVADKADGKLNFIISPLQQVVSTVSGAANSASRVVFGKSKVENPNDHKVEVTDEKVNAMTSAKFSEVLKKLRDALDAGTSPKVIKRGNASDAIDLAHIDYKEALSAAFKKSPEFKAKYDQKVIADAANACIDYSHKAPVYKVANKGEGEKAILALDKAINSQKSAISLIDAKPTTAQESVNDGTVFSTFFESTDMLGNAPDTTSAFLSTPDQNMNEIMSLLDRF